MDERIRQGLGLYVELFDEISEKADNDNVAVAIFQEMCKDRRVEQMKQERNGNGGQKKDELASEKQKNFMKKLNLEFPEGISKKEASILIDEELGRFD